VVEDSIPKDGISLSLLIVLQVDAEGVISAMAAENASSKFFKPCRACAIRPR
jgi:hypothetical protein